MYPPIYRDPQKAGHTRESVAKVIELLARPGVVVGLHPEGTRNRSKDPFELLPAQPGVGQIVHQSGADVIPVWIRGLGNDLPRQIQANFSNSGREIVVEFGTPVDLSAFQSTTGRASIYKRISDTIMRDIQALADKDRSRMTAEGDDTLSASSAYGASD